MKVVYLITLSDPIGGAQVHVRDLCISLKKMGHQVTVLVGNTGLFTEELQILGIPYQVVPHLIRAINPWYDVCAVNEIKGALKELNPDLLATHSSKAGWLGRIAGWSLGIPTTFTAHGWAFTEGVPAMKRKIYALAEKLAASLADKIINVSEFDRQLAIRAGVATPTKLVTIHNGVNDLPGALAIPENQPPRLIMVARFNEQKDHVTLLKALHLIREMDWEIDLIGDGPLRKDLEAMVVDLKLERRIQFLGERKDVAQLLRRSQLFLLISNWEGFPISILEAMRAKLPVVASDVGGVSEAVTDGVSGYLVPRGDEAALASLLGKLISNPNLRINMGEKGRRRFLADFAVGGMVEKTMACYLSVLKRC